MVIYNVTIKVSPEISAQWLQWLKEEHIPEMTGTGCFTHATVLKLLETDETEGETFAVQYHAESKALYDAYIQNYSAALKQKSFDKWGGQFIAFRTVMHIV
jgi:Domain of unknown function (DUF4286)